MNDEEKAFITVSLIIDKPKVHNYLSVKSQ